MDGFDVPGLHTHVLPGVWHDQLDGDNGCRDPLPSWLFEGIAHGDSHRVEARLVDVPAEAGEATAREPRHLWSKKAARRAKYESGVSSPSANSRTGTSCSGSTRSRSTRTWQAWVLKTYPKRKD